MFFIMFILSFSSFNISSMIYFMMSFWSKNYLYSIMMFLTLISGLLIIFLYFTSLISNMKNNYLINFTLILTFMMNMFMLMMMKIPINKSSSYFFPPPNFHLTFMNSNISNMNFSININKSMFDNIFYIYFYPYNNITLLYMFFLLMSMFIIKMCPIKSSSLIKN